MGIVPPEKKATKLGTFVTIVAAALVGLMTIRLLIRELTDHSLTMTLSNPIWYALEILSIFVFIGAIVYVLMRVIRMGV